VETHLEHCGGAFVSRAGISPKKQFFNRLKRHAAGQLFLDVWPGYAPLFDGTTHRLPGKVREMLELWQTNNTLKRESVESYAAYEGGDMIDVGAFHGWYSWLLAPKTRAGDRFISCEPDERVINDLLRNLATFAKVFPRIPQTFISQPVGNGGALTVQNPGGGHPQFGSDMTAEGDRKSVTLDALAATLGVRPAFVKIDVEGAEFGVLQGMERLLADVHPKIMLEIHPQWQPPGVTVEQVRGLLAKHGYRAGEADTSAVAVRQLWT
jgi:FkbM family methyltransferase